MASKYRGRPLFTDTFAATADIAAYRFVGYDGATCAANVQAMGIVEDDTPNGTKGGNVVVIGTAQLEYSENLAKGDQIAADADGRGKKAAATQEINAVAWEDGNAGEVHEVLIAKQGIV